MALNPNDSWASSSRTIVPRSTSVEYEKETQSTSTRRLPPPRKGPPPSRSAAAVAKLSKQQSVRYVPDSEEDAGEASQGRQERAKTPLESVVDLAKRTAFYLRQRSTEPDLGPSETSQNGHHNNESYDYEAEEREFQNQSAATKGRKTNNATLPKRGRISLDNKAYRPSQSDLEDSDDDVSDDGKRRRRRSKKNMTGPLTTLPVVGQEKRRRKKRGAKADGGGEEGEEREEEDSGSDSRVSPQVRRFIELIAGLLALISNRLAFYPFVSAILPAPGFTKSSISSLTSSRSICPTSSCSIHPTSRSIYPAATYVCRRCGPRLRRYAG